MRSNRAELHLPLAAGHAYRVILRMDPVAPSRDDQPALELWLNGEPLSILRLGFDPERTGEYVVDVPAAMVREGRNDLELRSERLVSAADLSKRPDGLPEHWDVALELRYVGIERLDSEQR